MLIHDATSGQSVKIDKKNRMATNSVTTTPISHISEYDGDAFFTYAKHTIQANATDEPVLFMEVGQSDKHVKVSHVVFSTNADLVKFEIHLAVTLNSYGTSEVPPKILNRSKNKASSLSSYDNRNNDLSVTVGTGSNEAELADIRLSTGQQTYTLDFKDSLLLQSTNNFYVLAEGDAGDKVRCSVYFYETSIE